KTGYVEVTATYTQPGYFSGIFGRTSTPVGAWAVARYPTPQNLNASIITLDASAKTGITISGGSTIRVPRAVYIDATGSSALKVGSGNTLIAPSISVVGGTSLGGTVSPTPVTGVARLEDPLNSSSYVLPTPSLP